MITKALTSQKVGRLMCVPPCAPGISCNRKVNVGTKSRAGAGADSAPAREPVRNVGDQRPEGDGAAEEPDRHLRRALQSDSDERVRLHPEFLQVTSQPVRGLVEFAVAQLSVSQRNRRRVGRAGGLGFEQLVHRLVSRVIGLNPVPVNEQLVSFRLGQQRESGQASSGIGDYFFEQQKPVAQLCHAGLVLAACGVLKGRRTAAYSALEPDIKAAGAEFVNAEAVVDGAMVSARAWPDHPAFDKRR